MATKKVRHRPLKEEKSGAPKVEVPPSRRPKPRPDPNPSVNPPGPKPANPPKKSPKPRNK